MLVIFIDYYRTDWRRYVDYARTHTHADVRIIPAGTYCLLQTVYHDIRCVAFDIGYPWLSCVELTPTPTPTARGTNRDK